MSNICDICGSSLSSAQTLKIHKKTAKKCLRLQENGGELKLVSERVDCQLCTLNILKSKYKRHLMTCKMFDIARHTYQNGRVIIVEPDGESSDQDEEKVQKLKDDLSKKNEELLKQKDDLSKKNEEILKQKDELLKQKDSEIAYLKEELKQSKDELKRYMSTLEKKAFEPKTVNNTYNKSQTLVEQYVKKPLVSDREKFEEAVQTGLKISHIKGGEIGIADFFLDEVARDKATGDLHMICCNKRTGVFYYMDEKEKIISDSGGALLLSNLNTNLVPLLGTKITDLSKNIPDETDRKEFKRVYGNVNPLGTAFTNHTRDRIYVSKIGAASSIREPCGDKKIRSSAASTTQSKITRDRRKWEKEEIRREKEEDDQGFSPKKREKYEDDNI